MRIDRAEVWSRVLVSAGFGVGTVVWWMASLVPALRFGCAATRYRSMPDWGDPLMMGASMCIVAGLVLGSRGLGTPLSFKRLLVIMSWFPNWLVFLGYIVSFGIVWFLRL